MRWKNLKIDGHQHAKISTQISVSNLIDSGKILLKRLANKLSPNRLWWAELQNLEFKRFSPWVRRTNYKKVNLFVQIRMVINGIFLQVRRTSTGKVTILIWWLNQYRYKTYTVVVMNHSVLGALFSSLLKYIIYNVKQGTRVLKTGERNVH